jgi:hypothetical protein
MPLAKNANEKFNAVKGAYLNHIIPSIRIVYEKANKVRESFVLVHCAILSLSGFYAGAKNTNGATYRDYVSRFFPKGYPVERLWRDLRNGLVHGYTLTSTFILTHKHPELHLYLRKNARSERTGELADLTFINFENFLDDFEQSAESYFKGASLDSVLLGKLCDRYDIAPPADYFLDEKLIENAKRLLDRRTT